MLKRAWLLGSLIWTFGAVGMELQESEEADKHFGRLDDEQKLFFFKDFGPVALRRWQALKLQQAFFTPQDDGTLSFGAPFKKLLLPQDQEQQTQATALLSLVYDTYAYDLTDCFAYVDGDAKTTIPGLQKELSNRNLVTHNFFVKRSNTYRSCLTDKQKRFMRTSLEVTPKFRAQQLEEALFVPVQAGMSLGGELKRLCMPQEGTEEYAQAASLLWLLHCIAGSYIKQVVPLVYDLQEQKLQLAQLKAERKELEH